MPPVLLNRTLVSTTNRSNFVDPTLLVDANFVPSAETPASLDVRTRLGLNLTEADDYHVKCNLGSVAASALVAAAFEDPLRTYETGRFSPPDVQVVTAIYGSTPYSLTPITGTLLPNCNVQIETSTGFAWLKILDTATSTWTYLWFANRILQFGTTTPSGAAGFRVNGGFLQLADTVSGGFRSIWWSGGVLQIGPVDNSSIDGNPPTAALLYFASAGTTLQMADQAYSGYFRSILLRGEVLGAGPLTAPPSGAALVDGLFGPASVSLTSPCVPVPDRITITYLATGVVGIVYGPLSGVFAARLVGGTIYPEWPSWVGITGGLSKSFWEVGDQVAIVARPIQFPWDLMQQSLAQSTYLTTLLQQQNLLTNFGQAVDSIAAVAVATLALGLSNPAVYPDV